MADLNPPEMGCGARKRTGCRLRKARSINASFQVHAVEVYQLCRSNLGKPGIGFSQIDAQGLGSGKVIIKLF